ncbi:MAG TPA: hypothetical protein VGC24_04865 [Burkholderiaceae bacterium]
MKKDYVPALLKLLACMVLPVAATAGFYGYEQKRLSMPWTGAVVPSPLPVGVQAQITDVSSLDHSTWQISGRVTDGSTQLRPTLVIAAPDGKALAYRTMPRRQGETGPRGHRVEFKGFSGFDVRVKKRLLPAGQPLRLWLAVNQDGRMSLLETGTDLRQSGS